MWTTLKHLAAQQTTPLEVAVFLVLVTVACVLASAAIYVAIMTGAWLIARRRGERPRGWREVVFPDKRFTVEQALAVLTSIILTLTLVEKDNVVDDVLALSPKAVDKALVENLFPLHRAPSVEFTKSVAIKSIGLGDLVHAPLQAGRSGEVRALFVDGLREVMQREPAWHARVVRWLPYSCVVLIALYLLWLTRGRIRELEASEEAVDSPYGDVFSRLTVLGVCLGLLLVTPAFTTDADLLADSAVAAARRAPATRESARVDSVVSAEFARQYASVNAGTVDATARRRLDQVAIRLDLFAQRLDAGEGVAGQIAGLRSELSALDARLAGLDPASRLQVLTQRVQSVSGQVETLSAQVTQLDARVSRGLVFIEAGEGQRFTLTGATSRTAGRGGAVGAINGRTRGLYWLVPGTYRIAGSNVNAQSFTIGAGEARAVSLTRGAVVE